MTEIYSKYLFALFTNYWEYFLINYACKIDLFDQIEQQKLQKFDLIKTNNINENIADDFFGFLEYKKLIYFNNSYVLNTEFGKILTEKHEKSLKYSCLLWSDEHLSAWRKLDYTFKTAKPAFEKYYKQNYFDFLSENPQKLLIYQKAMAEYALRDYKNICSVIDFSKHKTIMDIGGGIGVLIKIIAQKTHRKCYLFEKKEVINLVKDNTGFKKIVGDFFENIPKIAQALVLSRIIHDWNNKKASLILKNVYNAIPQNGNLYIIENFKDKIADKAFLLNINMKIMTGGYEREQKQYFDLLFNNGFYVEYTQKLNDFQYVICAKKMN